MSTIGSSDEFFSLSASCPYEDVELPGGQIVRVRGLTTAERDDIETQIALRRQQRQRAKKNGKRVPPELPFRPALVIRTAINEAGDLLFKPADINRVAQMPAQLVSPLADAAIRLSGMRAEDVEELEGNSDETDEDDSSSFSPSPSGEPSES